MKEFCQMLSLHQLKRSRGSSANMVHYTDGSLYGELSFHSGNKKNPTVSWRIILLTYSRILFAGISLSIFASIFIRDIDL